MVILSIVNVLGKKKASLMESCSLLASLSPSVALPCRVSKWTTHISKGKTNESRNAVAQLLSQEPLGDTRSIPFLSPYHFFT